MGDRLGILGAVSVQPFFLFFREIIIFKLDQQFKDQSWKRGKMKNYFSISDKTELHLLRGANKKCAFYEKAQIRGVGSSFFHQISDVTRCNNQT